MILIEGGMMDAGRWRLWIACICLACTLGCVGADGRQENQAADRLAREGLLAMEDGRFKDAEGLFSKAIELQKEDARLYFLRGVCHSTDNQLAKAIDDYTMALALDPGNVVFLHNRGKERFRLGQHQDALEDMNEAIGQQPDFRKALVSRAGMFCLLGEPEKALPDLDRVIALNNTPPEAYSLRGTIGFNAKTWEMALPDLLKAGEQGIADSQVLLGKIYMDGLGVKRDQDEAFRWYYLAAVHGNAQGQYALGAFYYFGQGVDQDRIESAFWYQKAALQGHAKAAYFLSLMLKNGIGISRNSIEALAWLERSAARGNANAQYDLGTLYLDGTGVKKDMEKALQWLWLAGEQGHHAAKKAIEQIQKTHPGINTEKGL